MATSVNNNVGSTADLFASLSPKAGETASTIDAAQDRFLKLYVTQLKNQDPLNPLDNAQVTSQLAQLNTVKGIETLNATVTKLMEAFNGNQTLQAAGMIGKAVLVPGTQLALQDGLGGAGFEIAADADQVKVKISDANGLLIRTLDLGAREAGSTTFAWDGKSDGGKDAVNGNYKFSVEALSAGKAVNSTALEFGTVNAVIRPTGSGSLQLDLGGAGIVSMNDVRRIL